MTTTDLIAETCLTCGAHFTAHDCTESACALKQRPADPDPKLGRIWRAGSVRRWHTNPHLAHTVDTLDGHCARVARIIMNLWPDDRDAIQGALIHDDGEHVIGDIPATHPKSRAQTLTEAAIIYDLWGQQPLGGLSGERLKFADKLDAHLWARHHAPHTLTGDGWPEARAWLETESRRLGVEDEVLGVLA